MLQFLSSIIENPTFQGALITILLGIIGWAIKKFSFVRHILNMAVLSYKYAEQQGLLLGLKGREKTFLFLENFVTRYEEKFGNQPSPTVIGIAIRKAEQEVLKEDHSGENLSMLKDPNQQLK